MAVNSAAVIGIGLFLYPKVKQHNEAVALGYVGIGIFESILMVGGIVSLLLLIPLRQEYVQASIADAVTLHSIGTLAVRGNFYVYSIPPPPNSASPNSGRSSRATGRPRTGVSRRTTAPNSDSPKPKVRRSSSRDRVGPRRRKGRRRRRGVRSYRPPRRGQAPGDRPAAGARTAFINDPAGHVAELVQPLG